MRTLTIAVLSCLSLLIVACGSSDADEPLDPFWQRMIVGGSEFERYDSLSEMGSAADLVVQASLVDFRRGRTFFGDAEEDVVHFAIVDLDISEVLRGDLVADRVTIEFLVTAHPDRIDEFFEAQASGLPEGELVLFLRDIASTEGHFYPDEGRVYRLVNSAGLWTEFNGAVRAPLSVPIEDAGPLYGVEVTGIATIEELAAAVTGP